MKAISLLLTPGLAALLVLPLEAVAGETQALQCESVRLEMDASLVQSSSDTELEDETEISIFIEDGTKFGPYKMTAAMQGEMGGTRMTAWKYKAPNPKGKNLTLRLMTTSKDSEPDLYVNGRRSSCKPI